MLDALLIRPRRMIFERGDPDPVRLVNRPRRTGADVAVVNENREGEAAVPGPGAIVFPRFPGPVPNGTA